jgi:DNA-binding FrmR family transcriptional regulator
MTFKQRDVIHVEENGETIVNCSSCLAKGDNIDIFHDRTTNRSQKMKLSLTTRLNRIEGQVRGIKGMIERDSYCDDILNQIFAVQSAMKSVGILLLENHMKGCIVKRIKEGELDVVDELLLTVEKLIK